MLNFNTPQPNYAATIVELGDIYDLAGLDSLCGCTILDTQVLIPKTYTQNTLYVLFTAETKLSKEFCHANNLFRDINLNKDNKTGYMEDNCRVKAIKFRKNNSCGLLLPISCLSYLPIDLSELKVGDSFNDINGHKVCSKYHKHYVGEPSGTPKVRKATLFKKNIIPRHLNTLHWARFDNLVSDDTEIIVTQKLHGTSIRLSHCLRPVYPSWILNGLIKAYNSGYGDNIFVKFIASKLARYKWDFLSGSREVIKLPEINRNGFYEKDIHAQAVTLTPESLPKNWTIYGELIGWAGDKPIQPKYTYNLAQGQYDLYVYRISVSNVDGVQCDLSFDQMLHWCQDNQLKVTPLIWRGPKGDFDHHKYMNIKYHASGYTNCVPLSPDSTCDEGVVVRIDRHVIPVLYKAKSPDFLIHETKMIDKNLEGLE